MVVGQRIGEGSKHSWWMLSVVFTKGSADIGLGMKQERKQPFFFAWWHWKVP